MAWNLHSPVQTPQPTHWVASMTALPPEMLMAGQPSRRQALQPRQLSVTILSGALCLTYLSRAQGRREMTTDGSSAASSSSVAGRGSVGF